MREIDAFLQQWGEDSLEVKAVFSELYNFLLNTSDLKLEWKARPGISYSLRLSINAANPEQPFFAMLDIIDDDPEERWLSLCMYADLADDPAKRGDIVPQGLNGQDAACFDIDENDEEIVDYLRQIINAAIGKAKSR